jgi:HlyD family secretion protein
MPGGSISSEGKMKPTVVWVKENESIHREPVVLGVNDGDNAEVKSGLNEGEQVVTKMTAGSAKETKKKEVATNPFMPRRPGSVTKTKTTTKS